MELEQEHDQLPAIDIFGMSEVWRSEPVINKSKKDSPVQYTWSGVISGGEKLLIPTLAQSGVEPGRIPFVANGLMASYYTGKNRFETVESAFRDAAHIRSTVTGSKFKYHANGTHVLAYELEARDADVLDTDGFAIEPYYRRAVRERYLETFDMCMKDSGNDEIQARECAMDRLNVADDLVIAHDTLAQLQGPVAQARRAWWLTSQNENPSDYDAFIKRQRHEFDDTRDPPEPIPEMAAVVKTEMQNRALVANAAEKCWKHIRKELFLEASTAKAKEEAWEFAKQRLEKKFPQIASKLAMLAKAPIGTLLMAHTLMEERACRDMQSHILDEIEGRAIDYLRSGEPNAFKEFGADWVEWWADTARTTNKAVYTLADVASQLGDRLLDQFELTYDAERPEIDWSGLAEYPEAIYTILTEGQLGPERQPRALPASE